MVMWITLLCSG